MKKIKFISALVFLLLTTTAYAETISISADGLKYNGLDIEFMNKPYMLGERIYISANEALEALGYQITPKYLDGGISVKKDNIQSIILEDSFEHIIGYKMYGYKHSAPVTDEVQYIPCELLEDITGKDIEISGDIPRLDGFTESKFRIQEQSFKECSNCYVLNNSYLFKPVTVHDRSARDYADAVNAVAKLLPEVNIYSMLVPDSFEIYAPIKYYTGQKRAMDIINNNLSSDITPIKIIDKLLMHGDEKIYFLTDHHWTHRGAYYGWQVYCEAKGLDIPSLDSFQRVESEGFKGSYVTRMPTGEMPEGLNSSEIIERFLPIYNTSVTVFSDSNMTKMLGKVSLINLKNNNYSCFISGDHPLTLIKSDVAGGKKLAIIKESFGNALATWAVNNYEEIYVIDIRGFKDGSLKIRDFYEKTKFDDLIIESYPTTIEGTEFRNYLRSMAQ